MNKRRLIALFLLPLLSNCSSHYVFESDISQENTQQYFSASKVEIFQSESLITTAHQYLGSVEGEDCQMKTHLAAPDVINARTQARQRAHEQGANGIVFTSCVDIESKHCVAQVVCYAKMYQVNAVDSKNANQKNN